MLALENMGDRMSQHKYRVSLFYSYCHTDESFRERMETALKPLRNDGHLSDWSDRGIIPGTPFTPQITEKLRNSDVVVFLVSPDFLASDACTSEWFEAKRNSEEAGQRLVPIIIRPCAWMEFDNMKDYYALPRDGTPVSRWCDEDEAWLDVSRSLKKVLRELRDSLEVKVEFKRRISEVDFVSKGAQGFEIDDLFVFPHLILDGKADRENAERRISSLEELSNFDLALIRGGVLSGKTTLCRKLFLFLVAKREPVLLIDLEEIGSRKPSEAFFREMHFGQLRGDYYSWTKRDNKTLILDNLSVSKTGFLEYAKKYFRKIIVTTSDDDYLAYFADDRRVSDFKQARLRPLSHSMQEDLIRKWKNLGMNDVSGQLDVRDSVISQIEKEVNAILANRIVPRYPFFVLSILQTYEGLIPTNLSITAYGHCYEALIVAHLIGSGIEMSDVGDCFDYLGELAFVMHQFAVKQSDFEVQNYKDFQKEHKRRYLGLEQGVLNRLLGQPTSVLALKERKVGFSWPYSYFFFLGLYLSTHYLDNGDLIDRMIDRSYLKDNSLSLMFLIHHSNNTELIEKILIHTICTLDGRKPIELNRDEIEVFERTLQLIPSDISTVKSVAEVRKEERNKRDEIDTENSQAIEESPHDLVNDIYKALKNMEILSQILKNKSRSIERTMLFETIETVTDTALRMASVFLLDSSEIDELAWICKKRLEKGARDTPPNLEEIKDELGILVFLLIMSCIERAVSAIDRKEVLEVVEELCTQKNTPAYDLIQSFYLIDISDRLTVQHVEMAKGMLRKHRKNILVAKALPIRIQMYMNSHRTDDSIRNAMKSQFRRLEDRRQTKSRGRR